jgi:hypothetical protein
MQVSVLTTDNGTHSPEKWAMATAGMIFPYDPATVGEHLIAAQKLQLAIAEALVPHHEDVQTAERDQLEADAAACYEAGQSIDHHLDPAIEKVMAAAEGTPWEEHFAKPEVQDAVRQVLGSHFATAQHIERAHHAETNPSEAAAVFKTRLSGVPQ